MMYYQQPFFGCNDNNSRRRRRGRSRGERYRRKAYNERGGRVNRGSAVGGQRRGDKFRGRSRPLLYSGRSKTKQLQVTIEITTINTEQYKQQLNKTQQTINTAITHKQTTNTFKHTNSKHQVQ